MFSRFFQPKQSPIPEVSIRYMELLRLLSGLHIGQILTIIITHPSSELVTKIPWNFITDSGDPYMELLTVYFDLNEACIMHYPIEYRIK